MEFVGYAWLVSSQTVIPLRARIRWERTPLEFEVRFGAADVRYSRDELERLWYGGGFPGWEQAWTVIIRV